MDFIIFCLVFYGLSCLVWKNWKQKPKQETFRMMEKKKLIKFY